MKFLVIGAGSIGKRHIKNLSKIGISNNNIFIVEKREDRRQEVASLGFTNVYDELNDSFSKLYDAAIIASPTNLHIEQCIYLAQQNKHMLVEKPLCSNLNEIGTLTKILKDKNLVAMMAYIFRFYDPIKLVKQKIDSLELGKALYFRGEFSEYLPDWHPYEDYRSFYMAEKKQGGGSILDQSHIFDIAHYYFGSFKSVIAFNSKISSLDINADDISELIVEMSNGVIASFHTDIFGRKHNKFFEIKFENGNIVWDFYKRTVGIFNINNKKMDEIKDSEDDFNKTYISEIKHFIEVCKGNEKSISKLEDGIETMKLILAAEKSHIEKNLQHL